MERGALCDHGRRRRTRADGGPAELSLADRWIRSRFGRMLGGVESALADYRFDFAASALYEFTWNEFCDWYLELAKPVLQSQDSAVRPPRARHAAHPA